MQFAHYICNTSVILAKSPTSFIKNHYNDESSKFPNLQGHNTKRCRRQLLHSKPLYKHQVQIFKYPKNNIQETINRILKNLTLFLSMSNFISVSSFSLHSKFFIMLVNFFTTSEQLQAIRFWAYLVCYEHMEDGPEVHHLI